VTVVTLSTSEQKLRSFRRPTWPCPALFEWRSGAAELDSVHGHESPNLACSVGGSLKVPVP
jgi:hypothetical protein